MKKILCFLLCGLMLVSITGCGNKKSSIDENSDTGENNNTIVEEEKVDIIEMYSEYIKNNIFNDDYDEINVVFIDFNDDNTLELVIKKDNNSYLQILYINGDSVNASEEYRYSTVVALFDVSDESYDFYIDYNSKYYINIKDILKQKSEPEEIEQDDKCDYTYVLATLNLSYYSVSKDSITDDLNKVQKKYTGEVITDDEKSDALEKVKEIQDATIEMTENGIKNSKYTIAFGTYAWGNYTITLNKDYTAVYAFSGFSWEGSFYIEYDTIHTSFSGASDLKLKINGNNQLIDSDNSIYNLK